MGRCGLSKIPVRHKIPDRHKAVRRPCRSKYFLWTGSRCRINHLRLYGNLRRLGIHPHSDCHVLLRIQHHYRMGLIRLSLHRIPRRRKIRPSVPRSIFLRFHRWSYHEPWTTLGHLRYLQRTYGSPQPDCPAHAFRSCKKACHRSRSGRKGRHDLGSSFCRQNHIFSTGS